MLTLSIRTDGAAFEDDAPGELARMLRKIAGRIEDGHNGGAVIDVNGNNVGTWELLPRCQRCGEPDPWLLDGRCSQCIDREPGRVAACRD